MSMEISNRIKSAREDKGLSLEAVAEKAQLSVDELQSLEAGNSGQLMEWPVVKVTHLADALGMNLSRLLGEPWLDYGEWALVWSALIEYSANQKGLQMDTNMKALIEKVKTFVTSQAN